MRPQFLIWCLTFGAHYIFGVHYPLRNFRICQTVLRRRLPLLQAPTDATTFINQIQDRMRYWLGTLNNGLPDNPKLRIREQGENRIHLTPLDKQAEPPNTAALKQEIGKR